MQIFSENFLISRTSPILVDHWMNTLTVSLLGNRPFGVLPLVQFAYLSSVIFIWTIVVHYHTSQRCVVTMVLSTWLILPKLSVQYYWRTSERFRLRNGEKATSLLLTWSKNVWRKWSQSIYIRQWRFIYCSCCVHIDVLCLSQVDNDLELKAYYAGHVLGAAMFYVKVRHQSVVYTVRW